MTGVSKDFDPNITHPLYFMRKGLLAKVSKFAPDFSGKLLDFGCGQKPYRSLFNVEEYIGIDYESAGHSHENEAIDVFYDGHSLPFAEGHFDGVFSSEVFEHVFNLRDILKEVNRVMKPGAKLLFTCPFIWNEHEIPNDFARYTQFALRDIMEKAGFRVIVHEKSGNFVKALSQLNILFFTPLFYKIPVLWRILIPVYCLLLNGTGALFSLIFPKRTDLYLSNVMLAEKI